MKMSNGNKIMEQHFDSSSLSSRKYVTELNIITITYNTNK